MEALPPGASERISSTSCTWLAIRGMCAEPQDIRKSISKKLLATTVIIVCADVLFLVLKSMLITSFPMLMYLH